MVRFLEANGYDVKYISGVDTERRAGNLIGASTKPKAFFSVGHDEYWSAGQRASVEAARNAGVNLAFFSGNEIYWKTRFEPSVDGTNTPYRTLVGYKDTLGGVKLDPMPNVTTGTWRDTRFGPPVADGGRPENALDRPDLDRQLGNVGDQRPRLDGEPALLEEHARRDPDLRRRDAGDRHARL